jgi:hypothetical protein
MLLTTLHLGTIPHYQLDGKLDRPQSQSGYGGKKLIGEISDSHGDVYEDG